MDSGVARIKVDHETYVETLRRRQGRTYEVMSVVVSRARRRMTRIAFPEGNHPRILRAAQQLFDEGICTPVLLGRKEEILEQAREAHLSAIEELEIIDPLSSDRADAYAQALYQLRQRNGVSLAEALYRIRQRNTYAAMMLREGAVDGLVTGLTRTYPEAIRPSLEIVRTQAGRRASGTYIVAFKESLKLFADCTVNADPTAEELADIAISTAELARAFELKPRIAMLSYSNFGTDRSGSPAKVRRAVELLLGAKRPVIVCGSGAKMSSASPEILALAEHLAAPVGCAHRGKGVIPEDHPLALGLCGAEARLYANKIVADADVVLAVGMRFTEPDTSSWQPGAPYQIPPSKLIHIDIDPDELARYYPTEVAIWADAKAAVEEILGAVRAQHPEPARLSEDARIQELGRAREAWRLELQTKQNDDVVPIRPERLMKELREAIPRDGIVFVDTGKVKNWAYQQFEAYAPDSFYIGIGWTAMGHSPAAALGVKLANPDRPVVAFVGDGGFQMVPWTLSTAVDYDIPVTTVVFNDLAYGAVRDIQKADYEQHYLSVDPVIEKSGARFNPDFAQMAELYGARGFRVEKPGQLGPALRAAMACGAPSVVDVLIDRDVRFPVAKQRAFRHLPKY